MRNLFGESVAYIPKRERGGVHGGVGCEHCPQNGVPNVHKVLGLDRIKGRRAMLWAQSPGPNENAKGLELVGKSGKLLWDVLQAHGLRRSDFDVQNVMRCWPIDRFGQEHNPTKRELRCCSIHNVEALERNAGKAAVHLILGEVAGRQLLGGRYRKDTAVVWHEPWDAYAVLCPHPSYILRLGGVGSGWAYYSFCDRMKAVAAALQHPGRWGYVLAQDYGSVTTPRQMDQLLDLLYFESKAGRRISVDLEDGVVGGKRVPLMVGFGWGNYPEERSSAWSRWEGGARSVLLDHPEAQLNKRDRALLERRLTRILGDKTVRKALQHGSYDANRFEELFGISLEGYDYDTQYGTYLRHSHLRSYAFSAMVTHFFQEFGDYKEMVAPWSGNFVEAPLTHLVPYNCADCDLTKRLEVRFAPQVSSPLVQVYIEVAFVLDAMEERGPLLDRQAHKELSDLVPGCLENLGRKIRFVADKPDFNPDAHPQVAWLLFDKLKLPMINGRSTQKEVLVTLYAEHGHPVLKNILTYRAVSRIQSTYLRGYATSADRNDGFLRTIWWLTGTVTGRLRSGRGERSELEGIVNFQNLHGNPLLQNLLVSDKNWRKALGKV